MYSPNRASSVSQQLPTFPAPVADAAGDAALAALDGLLDLDRAPDSQATVIARDFVVPADARRPDDEPTVMLKGTRRILVGLPTDMIPTPLAEPTPLVLASGPTPVPAPLPMPAKPPRTSTTPPMRLATPSRSVRPAHVYADANARWIVAGIWAAALAAFLVLAMLVTAHEKEHSPEATQSAVSAS